MQATMSTILRRKQCAGLTLFEALLALLLLAVCLVPASEALRDAVAQAPQAGNAARDLDCVSSRMEVVLAEPYQRLLASAGDAAAPSAYSTAGAEDCPAIAVYIARYGNDKTGKIGSGADGDHLLYVAAELADAGAGNRFPLATLVTR